jgi:DNA-binding transcriptional MocR family regulator
VDPCDASILRDEQHVPDAPFIDFGRSLPPVPPDLHTHLMRSFEATAAAGDLGRLTHRSVPRGSDEDRDAGCQLLERRFDQRIERARLIVTNGTQNAILMLLRRIAGQNGLVVAEALSYGPLRWLAEAAGVRLTGLAIDDEGIVPDAFEAACRAEVPRVLYTNPTVQNPTTAITPEARRVAIAAIARRYGVTIIEDDALGLMHLDAPRPIAALAPDVTWYVMTTTKCLSHGLRVAYLVAPSCEAAAAIIGPIEHLSSWHAAPLLAAMVSRWIQSGAAEQITASIARECMAREAAAKAVLGSYDLRSKQGSMHVWLHLPARWTSDVFVSSAAERGVRVRPAGQFAVDGQPVPQAVRLSLSAPAGIDEVQQGLEVLKAMLRI